MCKSGTHTMSPSSPVVTMSSLLGSTRAVCPLCPVLLSFIQLHYREALPLHRELRTIMQFGTTELVTPVRTHSGAYELIGSWPYRAPSGSSTGNEKKKRKRYWMQQHFHSLVLKHTNSLFFLKQTFYKTK